MTEVFRCLDYRQREVMLTHEAWDGHILCEHSYLVGLEGTCRKPLRLPILFARTPCTLHRYCYYGEDILPGSFACYLKVVVQFEKTHGGLWLGNVITAYEADQIKSKEKQIYGRNRS